MILGYTPAQMKKAIVAFVTPGVVAFGAALTASSPEGSTITGAEWTGIAVAMFGTGILVFTVKNSPTEPAHPRAVASRHME